MAQEKNSFDERVSKIAKDETIDIELRKLIIKESYSLNFLSSRAAHDLKKFWHNTPLVVTLLGIITISANFLASYIINQQKSKTDETSKISESERRLLQAEKEFAFKIIERELSKSEQQSSRAEVLLFLVRAGILNSLNRSELERMALIDLQRPADEIGIPPTLGLAAPRYSVPLPDPSLSANPLTAKIARLATIELNSNVSEEETIGRIMTYWSSVSNFVGQVDRAPWSGAFLTWLLREAGISSIQGNAANIAIWRQARQAGQTFLPKEDTPKPGDIALFSRGQNDEVGKIIEPGNNFYPTSIGVVYSYDNNAFRSIEPNVGNAIRLANHSMSDRRLIGFMRFSDPS